MSDPQRHLSDAELAEIKGEMESGKTIQEIRRERNLPRRVRPMMELIEVYGREIMGPIMNQLQRKNRSRTIAQIINTMVMSIDNPVEMDDVIAAVQDGLLRLEMRRQELSGEGSE